MLLVLIRVVRAECGSSQTADILRRHVGLDSLTQAIDERLDMPLLPVFGHVLPSSSVEIDPGRPHLPCAAELPKRRRE